MMYKHKQAQIEQRVEKKFELTDTKPHVVIAQTHVKEFGHDKYDNVSN